MPDWKQIASKPAGALPANLVTKVGVVLITVLLIALILSASLSSDDPDDLAGAAPGSGTEEPIVAPGMARGLRSQIEQQERQQEHQQLIEERDAERQRIRDALGITGGRLSTGSGGAPAEPPPLDPDTGEELTPEEHELRQAIRLEELERQLRSLRTQPVAQSYRGADGMPGGAGSARAASTPASPPTGLDVQPFAAAAQQSTDALIDALTRAEALPGADPSGYRPDPGELDVPLPDSSNLPDYDTPPRFSTPRDHPGWERIFEGSFAEAVLVTQLTGDFPSPVLATVAVPFYSADRQRVLIPRGSRFIGTAQPVRGQDQERLAVGFHRVILPDGTHVPLQFQGLNQLGEGALKDQVNRHYFSTFLAAGAVGLMSGFAAIGANPYAGGLAGYRSGVAQSTSQSGIQLMNRFLNRFPTVTIRAGHRLRIWFTSDALFPSHRRSLP